MPADKPTIQQALNSALDGDTVLVSAGTYNEDLTFPARAVALSSTDGAATTIINGTGTNSVIYFGSGAGNGATPAASSAGAFRCSRPTAR